MNLRYTAGWIAIGLLALGLEVLALADPSSGDTLSEQVRWLTDLHLIVWFALGSGLLWFWLHVRKTR